MPTHLVLINTVINCRNSWTVKSFWLLKAETHHCYLKLTIEEKRKRFAQAIFSRKSLLILFRPINNLCLKNSALLRYGAIYLSSFPSHQWPRWCDQGLFMFFFYHSITTLFLFTLSTFCASSSEVLKAMQSEEDGDRTVISNI